METNTLNAVIFTGCQPINAADKKTVDVTSTFALGVVYDSSNSQVSLGNANGNVDAVVFTDKICMQIVRTRSLQTR